MALFNNPYIGIQTTMSFLALLSVSFYFISKYFNWRWDEKTLTLTNQVLGIDEEGKGEKKGKPLTSTYHDKHELFIQDNLKTLPFAVQRHLVEVLSLILDRDSGKEYMVHQPIKIIRSVKIEQEGKFFHDELKAWVPIQVHQQVSASPAAPGFVLDGTMKPLSKFPFFTFHRRDSYVQGKGGGLDMNIMKILSITQSPRLSVHQRNTEELMLWLMQSVMFPTAFFPHNGGRIKFEDANPKPSEPTTFQNHLVGVNARILDASKGVQAHVQFRFDSNGLISTICGFCPRAMGSESNIVMAPWECRVRQYKCHDGMLVPTELYFGWWTDNKLQIVLKVRNKAFSFSYFD